MRCTTNHADLGPPDRAWHGVFVPTMGALHAGHAALINHARALIARAETQGPVMVSIFVNPTQFNDPKDLERYPRTLDADLDLCRAAGADIVFAPAVETIYPPTAPPHAPALPSVATQPGLEDAHRPGHFAGVCQVVHRLFDLVRPAAAVFGEKDWQQLQVITAMTAAVRLPIRIIPSPTIREPDGLALSTRNRFLSPEVRPRALALSRALRAASAESTAHAAERAMLTILESAALGVEYAVIRDAATLMPIPNNTRAPSARAIIAARCGPVRLIDNAPWQPAPHSRSAGTTP